MNSSYVIITPVRNEETYLHFTIESVSRQVVQPVEWVIALRSFSWFSTTR